MPGLPDLVSSGFQGGERGERAFPLPTPHALPERACSQVGLSAASVDEVL